MRPSKCQKSMWPVFERSHSKLITFFWCFKLVLWLWCFWSAKTIVVSELKFNVKEQLSSLSEFTSSWSKTWKAESGVAYRTRTVLRILLGLQTTHSLRYAGIIILFWRPRRRAFRFVDLKVPNILSIQDAYRYIKFTQFSDFSQNFVS